MYEIRPVIEPDLHHVIDIDVKCFYRAWSKDKWVELIRAGAMTYVLAFGSDPVGFLTFQEEGEGDDKRLRILKVAVKTEHRGNDFANELLLYAIGYCNRHDISELLFTVGEDLIFNSGPYNIRDWVTESGFVATGVSASLDTLHGEPVDGINYLLELREVDLGSLGIVPTD